MIPSMQRQVRTPCSDPHDQGWNSVCPPAYSSDPKRDLPSMTLTILTLIGCCALQLCVQTSWAEGLPEAWRVPSEAELSDDYRQASPTRFATATVDFNSDGVPDEAFLVKSTKFNGQGLLVRVSDTNGDPRWITLDVIDWGPQYPQVNLAMGIEVMPPGTYPYLCLDSDEDCAMIPRQERPKKTIETPSLMY